MEANCKIVMFGDSITHEVTPKLEKCLREEFPESTFTIINEGVIGETSRDGIVRLENILKLKPTVCVIGFGMNDWRKGVEKSEFREHLETMIDRLQEIGTRVIPMTISPSREKQSQTDAYSKIIREVGRQKRIKIADVNSLWDKSFRNRYKPLRDDLHPDKRGYSVYLDALIHTVPRHLTTILWQYNGREAKCNYRCPYCYYIGQHNSSDSFFGTIEQWHKGFLESFGNQNLVFYLGFGEPMLGANFFDVVKMIESEPRWSLRVISNISLSLEPLINSKLAKDERLYVNASFHPSMTSLDDFLQRLLLLREHGIEAPVVYTMWPPYINQLEHDIEQFQKHGFVVHVRRFQGIWEGREYPFAYTDDERQLIAKYSDDNTIKYMLNQKYSLDMTSYMGFDFFIVDNVGNVGYDSDSFLPYTKLRCIFGNIHQRNFRPNLLPMSYPGKQVGTADGVANLIESGMHQLEGNHVAHFSAEGGVTKDDTGVHYKHLHTDFADSRIRAKYYFPPRNSCDQYQAYLQQGNRFWIDWSDRKIRAAKTYIKSKQRLFTLVNKLFNKG